MAFRKARPEPETSFNLKAEIGNAKGDVERLMGQLLSLSKGFDTARRSLIRRAQSPRNVPVRAQLKAKAAEALSSKKRASLIVHALMHKVRAPGMATEDWCIVEQALSGKRGK